MKKIYNFSEKSELPKFGLPVKLVGLFFSAVTALEMKKKNAEIRARSLSCLPASSLNFTLVACACASTCAC